MDSSKKEAPQVTLRGSFSAIRKSPFQSDLLARRKLRSLCDQLAENISTQISLAGSMFFDIPKNKEAARCWTRFRDGQTALSQVLAG
jgi:hypothetical protein